MPQTNLTALVVDEAQEWLNSAALVLEAMGYRVLRASDAGEALRLLDCNPARIDLLLTSAAMPAVSGLELAARLRATWPDLKVIYTSSFTDAIRIEGALDSASASLKKPFTSEELARKVRVLITNPRAAGSGS